MHRCVGLMISGSMLFACDPRDFLVFAQSWTPAAGQRELLSIQAGHHLIFRQGLQIVDVESLRGQDGLHVFGHESVVEIRGNRKF